MVTDNRNIAEIFQRAFSSVFTIDDKTSTTGPHARPNQCELQISETGVLALLNSVDIRKACGKDDIPNSLIKNPATQLAPVVTKIVQYSIDCGESPDDWKCGRVCPVYKKGPITDPLNYRPIALTSVLGKQLEHIIAKKLRLYLDDKKLLADIQHGFRQRRSCETQLVTTIHAINKLNDSGADVDAIVLDFSKAFDKVSHQNLYTS